jgi:hypothetical protein
LSTPPNCAWAIAFACCRADTIPADGEIVSGTTTLDQASITGESLPVDAEPGTAVYAGTTNLTGAVEFRVTKTGGDTVIGRVTNIVEEAKTSRAPVMRLIDEYTRYYMPFVLIVAGFVLFFTRDVERGHLRHHRRDAVRVRAGFAVGNGRGAGGRIADGDSREEFAVLRGRPLRLTPWSSTKPVRSPPAS